MNITELRYLVAIKKWGSVSAAAKQLYAAQPNVSKALKNLEAKGLICRISEKQDGRLKRIELTSKAEEIRHLITSEIAESENLLLKGITEEERRIYLL